MTALLGICFCARRTGNGENGDGRRGERGSGGSDPAETDYTYTWLSDSLQVLQKTTTHPIVATSQNGSGTANSRMEVYDEYGRINWSMDENGAITYTLFDNATGAPVQRIDDVNTGEMSGAPAGWSSPDGLNLVTDYEFDLLARTVQILGPTHTIDLGGTATAVRRANWMIYQDALFQTWQGRGYATGSGPDYAYTLINPVMITQYDQIGRVTDVMQAVRSSGSSSEESESGPLLPTDEFPQSSWTRWSTSFYDNYSNFISKSVYFDIPALGAGTAGVNYNQTAFAYDLMERQNRVATPGGTITRTVYHPMDWVLQIWVGTNDTGATDSDPSGGGAAENNMVIVQANEYDDGAPGGDGNLTQMTQYQNATVTRVTTYGYDFRDRRTYTDGEIDFYQSFTLDNLNRATQIDQYDTTVSGNLVARTAVSFDPLGRTYQTIVYGVDPSTGTIGNGLISNFWFDPVGNVVKTLTAGSQLAQKTVYDGVRRATTQYSSYNVSETGYPYPITVTGDTIIQQSEFAYDGANNLISTTSRARFDNATGTGSLTSPSGAQPQARVSYQGTWPDPLGRVQATANYGTNGAEAWTLPATVPASSATILVNSTAYNARGEAYKATDPLGTVKLTTLDDAGRQTQLLENYVSGGSEPTENRQTDLTYNPDSNLAAITAKNSVTGDQVTQFIYGTTLSNSDIASNALLYQKIYPDDSEAAPDRATFAYDRLGEMTQLTDPNGTIHQYQYDLLGRQVQDCVTSAAAGIDTTVLRIGRTYEVRGLVQSKRHSNPS